MIKHVLADGRQVESIAGRVIKLNDFKALYNIIDSISQKGGARDQLARKTKTI